VTRLLVAALLLAACAASPREDGRARLPESATLDSDHLEISAAHQEIRRLESSLSDAEVQAAGPDCPRVAQLRDNICDLARRICRIAGRQPKGSAEASTAMANCLDGDTRCRSAAERARSRGCPAAR
jgi:hypothetical protein